MKCPGKGVFDLGQSEKCLGITKADKTVCLNDTEEKCIKLLCTLVQKQQETKAIECGTLFCKGSTPEELKAVLNNINLYCSSKVPEPSKEQNNAFGIFSFSFVAFLFM